ncbi:MAG: flagellar protein FlgN [bacterium]|nr:flagellar protein FlgN [bacterium]
MNHDDNLQQLINALREEAEGYRELLVASDEQTDCLIKGDTSAISLNLQRQMEAMELSRRLSEHRHNITRVMARGLNLGDPCSTGRLLAALPGDNEELLTAHSLMKDITMQLTDSNGTNRRLLEHRLDLLNGDFESMHKMLHELTNSTESDNSVEGALLSVKA